MLGLSLDKFLLIGVIAVFIIGPQRLPEYAAKLATLVRGLRAMSDGAKGRLRDEMGPEFDNVDWQRLDPRKYDPRRIIREALTDDLLPTHSSVAESLSSDLLTSSDVSKHRGEPIAPFLSTSPESIDFDLESWSQRNHAEAERLVPEATRVAAAVIRPKGDL